MIKINLLVTLILLLVTTVSYAQIGIGTTTPNSAAALDVTATDKGLLPPRMTESDRDNISNPPAGLMIWCTNFGGEGQIQVYNGVKWTNIISGAIPTPDLALSVDNFTDDDILHKLT